MPYTRWVHGQPLIARKCAQKGQYSAPVGRPEYSASPFSIVGLGTNKRLDCAPRVIPYVILVTHAHLILSSSSHKRISTSCCEQASTPSRRSQQDPMTPSRSRTQGAVAQKVVPTVAAPGRRGCIAEKRGSPASSPPLQPHHRRPPRPPHRRLRS